MNSLMNNDKMIEKIVFLMETDKSADAPADAVKWAKNIFRTRAVEPKRSLIERIVGVLQLDLAPNKAVFGERSATSATRQMLFGAGDNSVDLRIGGDAKNLKIAGQILGEGFGGATVRLEGIERRFETIAGELSEFRFERVTAGTYRLVATSATKEIVIDGIEVG